MTTRATKPRPSARALALDANALDLFARIVEAGSFAQAARGLRLTRAAVSRRVAAIEAALGQPLFARTTRALALTEAGRRLAAQARAVAEATDAARAGLRTRGSALAGTLRVTAVPIFGQTILAPLLARFQAAHSELRLELAFTNRRVDLLREEVDVAFRITRRPPPEWVARPLLAFRVLACARPRAGVPLPHPQALADERCLVLGVPADSFDGHWSGPRGLVADIELVPACVGDDLVSLVGMAEAGDAIVFAPDFAVAGELAAGRLVDALPGWTLRLAEGQEVVALALPQPAVPEAARALVQFVADALR